MYLSIFEIFSKITNVSLKNRCYCVLGYTITQVFLIIVLVIRKLSEEVIKAILAQYVLSILKNYISNLSTFFTFIHLTYLRFKKINFSLFLYE